MSDAPLEVDHPAWARPVVVGRPEDDFYNLNDRGYPEVAIRILHRADPIAFLDPEGGVHEKLEDAVRWVTDRLAESTEDIEQMKHAAKNQAREVEEDQHTP